MFVHCCVCEKPVLQLVQMSQTVHKVMTLPEHGATVGSQQFCKDHTEEAVEAQRKREGRNKG